MGKRKDYIDGEDNVFRRQTNPTPLAGCYDLVLYCDHDNPDHAWNEFPHQFLHELGSRCRKMAKEAGWTIRRDGTATCPKCNARKKR